MNWDCYYLEFGISLEKPVLVGDSVAEMRNRLRGTYNLNSSSHGLLSLWSNITLADVQSHSERTQTLSQNSFTTYSIEEKNAVIFLEATHFIKANSETRYAYQLFMLAY